MEIDGNIIISSIAICSITNMHKISKVLMDTLIKRGVN
jgi:hypothetical protein